MTLFAWQLRVRSSRRLTWRGKLLGLVLSLRADFGELTAWPSVERLAREAGVSESTARRGLQELRRMRYLHVEYRGPKGRNRTNLYTLRLPDDDWGGDDDWTF